ncbi:hypothetical protein KTH_46540 [Thermosporothrix hazakensis]|nr:hypothetical protein KTH_46540 [Thermosporothrix hazakensis]
MELFHESEYDGDKKYTASELWPLYWFSCWLGSHVPVHGACPIFYALNAR